MTETYEVIIRQGFNIIEFYNPTNGDKHVILFTNILYPVKTSVEDSQVVTVDGFDITDFLNQHSFQTRDNLVNFTTNFTAFIQKRLASTIRFSLHWPFKVIS